MNPGRSAPYYPVTSLYVGDLHADVNETMLHEKFSTVAPIVSIRVCRDVITRRSLGYAYINFQHPADAERALETLNYEVIKGRPIRIMWSQRDPVLRKSGAGNVFIKNLDKTIDNKVLYDMFSAFGSILSCKVAQDENGVSKRHGFVHFETEEAANKSIAQVNGMMLNGKQVYVGHFIPRMEREKTLGKKHRRLANVFIKNFGISLTENMLVHIFQKYGEIISHKIMTNDNGVSRGFGFVTFKDPKAAKQAVREMNGREIFEGKHIYVGIAQKKSERQQQLKRKFEQERNERLSRYQGVNLYVRNLDDTIDDVNLRKVFEPFGTVTSAKVAEGGPSKGFGYVCFSSPEEAAKAVTEMNGRMVGTKPLRIVLAQSKKDQRACLALQPMANMHMPQMGQSFQPSFSSGYFIPVLPQPQYFYGQFQPAPIRATPRWPVHSQVRPYPQVSPFRAAARAPSQASAMRNMRPMGRPIIGRQQSTIQQPIIGAVNPANMRNPPQQMSLRQPAAVQQAAQIEDHQQLTASMLAAMSPQQQKQMLGERLYPLIQQMYKKLAGKITGMLLELDNSDLLHLLEDNESLKEKVAEAVAVLQGEATHINKFCGVLKIQKKI